jgi:hypothetical protein
MNGTIRAFHYLLALKSKAQGRLHAKRGPVDPGGLSLGLQELRE